MKKTYQSVISFRPLKAIQLLSLSFFLLFYSSVKGQFDLSIAINGSGSVSPSEFQLQIDAIKDCVSKLPKNGTVGFSLTQYSGSATLPIPYTLLTASTDIAAINASIDAIDQLVGSTNSALGIETAANEILNNGTPGFEKIVLLATDGEHSGGSAGFQTSATTIQNNGIDEFGVIVIDVMSVLNFYQPFPFGGGTAEFAASFMEFQAILDQYCTRLVETLPPTEPLPGFPLSRLIMFGLIIIGAGTFFVYRKNMI